VVAGRASLTQINSARYTWGEGRCDGGEGNTRPGGERVSVKSFNPFRRVRAHAPEFFARVYNIYAGPLRVPFTCFPRGDGIFLFISFRPKRFSTIIFFSSIFPFLRFVSRRSRHCRDLCIRAALAHRCIVAW